MILASRTKVQILTSAKPASEALIPMTCPHQLNQPPEGLVEKTQAASTSGVSLGCLSANPTWSSSSCRTETVGQEEQNEEQERKHQRIMELRRNPPVFLTLQETADFLRVSKDTIRRWAKAGRIRQYNRGTRNPLFASAELISAIKEAC